MFRGILNNKQEYLFAHKRAGVAMVILSRINFKTKIVTRDKEGPFIMMKWFNLQEDITILNICGPSNNTPNT